MTPSVAATSSFARVWLVRLRFLVATAIVWGLFHYLGASVVPRGLDRAPVLYSSPYGPLGGIAVILLFAVGAAASAVLVGGEGLRLPLMAVGTGIAVWLLEAGAAGGTMDKWLIARNPVPGPPRGLPYALLLVDYLYLIVAVVGTYIVVTLVSLRDPRLRRRAMGLDSSTKQRLLGMQALAISVVVAGVTTVVLAGPATQETLRGQVFFAVGMGFIAGVAAAKYVSHVTDPLWYLPGPLLLGIIGLLVATFSPGLQLPAAYRHLNVIPAWGLSRALPLEMVALGMVGTLWLLKPEGETGGAR